MQVQRIKNAINSKNIEDATDKEIAQEFQKIYFLIGLRSQYMPNNEQAVLMFSYIRNNYRLKKLDELFIAFDFYIQGYYCTDIKFYDQFTLQNFNNIMNGYRQYVNDLNFKLREVKPPESQIKILAKEEKISEIEEFLNRKDLTERNLVLIPSYIYENMLKFGYINQTEKEKIELYNRSTKMYEYRLRMDATNFDKFLIMKLNKFVREKEDNFNSIDKEFILEIHQLYQKLSVLNEIKKRQNINKESNKVSSTT